MSESTKRPIVAGRNGRAEMALFIQRITFQTDHGVLRETVRTRMQFIEGGVGQPPFVSELAGMRADGAPARQFKEMGPEWDLTRDGGRSTFPISHTRNERIGLRARILVKRLTGGPRLLERVTATAAHPALTFVAAPHRRVVEGDALELELTSSGRLPDDITVIEERIRWEVELEGRERPLHIGTSGPHLVYVTLGVPTGRAEASEVRIGIHPAGTSYRQDTYADSGDPQLVTEARLRFAVEAIRKAGGRAAGRAGLSATRQVPEAAEYAGALFKYLKDTGVGYAIGYRWLPDKNKTGLSPRPDLHHYLWSARRGKPEGSVTSWPLPSVYCVIAWACPGVSSRATRFLGRRGSRAMARARPTLRSMRPVSPQSLPAAPRSFRKGTRPGSRAGWIGITRAARAS